MSIKPCLDLALQTSYQLRHCTIIHCSSVLHVHVPVVLIPKQHPEAVDNVLLVELHGDCLAVLAVDGVRGVALLSVIVLSVAVQQHVSPLALNGGSFATNSGHILLGNWGTVKQTLSGHKDLASA